MFTVTEGQMIGWCIEFCGGNCWIQKASNELSYIQPCEAFYTSEKAKHFIGHYHTQVANHF